MNDTDVQATNTDCKPKLHKNYKLVLQIWLVNNNVVPGSTKMLTQGHVALGKITYCFTCTNLELQISRLFEQCYASNFVGIVQERLLNFYSSMTAQSTKKGPKRDGRMEIWCGKTWLAHIISTPLNKWKWKCRAMPSGLTSVPDLINILGRNSMLCKAFPEKWELLLLQREDQLNINVYVCY